MISRAIDRFLIFALASILFVSGFLLLLLFILPEYILPLNLPFYGWALIYLLATSPLIFCFLYVIVWGMNIPEHLQKVEGLPKNWKGWVFAYLFFIVYILCWALLAWIFDGLMPFIPFFYRQVIAPQIVLILILVILGQNEEAKGFLKRFAYGSDD